MKNKFYNYGVMKLADMPSCLGGVDYRKNLGYIFRGLTTKSCKAIKNVLWLTTTWRFESSPYSKILKKYKKWENL